MAYCSQLRKDNLLYILSKGSTGYDLKFVVFDKDIEDQSIMASTVLFLPRSNESESVCDAAVCIRGGFFHFDSPKGKPVLTVVDHSDMELFMWGDQLVHLQYKCALDMEIEDDENLSRDFERACQGDMYIFA
jgi:hypothetical protein